MSATRHTPGPWTVITPKNARGQELPPKIIGKAPNPIATLNLAGDGRREANAALISAAPELLEALTAFVEAAEEAGAPPHPHHFAMAHAAIAKAQA